MTDNGFPALRAAYITGFGMAAGSPPSERQLTLKRKAEENNKIVILPSKNLVMWWANKTFLFCDYCTNSKNRNETTLVDNSPTETTTSTAQPRLPQPRLPQP